MAVQRSCVGNLTLTSSLPRLLPIIRVSLIHTRTFHRRKLKLHLLAVSKRKPLILRKKNHLKCDIVAIYRNVKNIQKLNETMLEMGVEDGQAWHKQYKDSAYVFIGMSH